MRVEGQLGPGKAAGVDNARVIRPVGDDQVQGACQGGDGSEIGLVAGGEEQGGFCPDKRGEGVLECKVLWQGSGNQARRPGAEAGPGGGFGSCAREGRMAGEPEVVVRTKSGQAEPVAGDVDA